MPGYTHDHAHLRSRDPEGTARYYNEMFDAAILESVQSDGVKLTGMNINGFTVLIARVSPDEDVPATVSRPRLLGSC